jgi:hypothetical protein
MTVIIDPDCAAGKHNNCDGTGWDENTEALADCPCTCHAPAEPIQHVRILYGMPGVRPGRVGTLHDAAPGGHTNNGLKWVDLGEPIQWSFGQSESTGFWAGPAEYDLIPEPLDVPDQEILELEIGKHIPVLSVEDGSIRGCQCMDRVFYRHTEDWPSHLADVVLGTTVVLRLRAANEELTQSIGNFIGEQHAWAAYSSRVAAARAAVAGPTRNRPLPGHGPMITGSRSKWYSIGVADSITRFDAALAGEGQ